ncbi:MAG TPA: oxaloacetate decarboxylase [Porphyromonadaceae bacterium]|jgi:oxaloacetate decarboxylase gamma subunit|nr:putative rane protein [Proteiniphilum sp.]MDK2853105.1 oxaloacetate decarboxylase (Na+ extruding) subunit gamma [Proteiniphilum sp.]HCC86101.1 oxaloacetate decarboxylase [Porphyromonadaceae bacterium]
MENLNEALGLLAVGMVTVVIILCLVVVIGNLVINLTNRFIPDDKRTGDSNLSGKLVNTKKVAAIAAVVDVITRGSGRVDTIEKR